MKKNMKKKMIVMLSVLVLLISLIITWKNFEGTDISQELLNSLNDLGYDTTFLSNDESNNFMNTDSQCYKKAMIEISTSEINKIIVTYFENAEDVDRITIQNYKDYYALALLAAPIRAFKYENTIVEYVGDNEHIVEIITNICGDAFYG